MGPQNDDEFRQYGNNLGLIGAGLALMSPPRQGGGLPGAFRGYLSGQDQAMQMARMEQVRRMQAEQLGMQRERHQSAMEQAKLELDDFRERLKRGSSIRAQLQSMYAPGSPQAPAGGLDEPQMGADPTGGLQAAPEAPGMAPQAGARNARGARYEQLMREANVYAQHGEIEAANKLRDAAVKLAPKLKEQKVVIHPATGKPAFFNLYEDGTGEFSDIAQPTAKRSFQNLGGEMLERDDYTGQDVRRLPVSMTEAQRLADQRAREQIGISRGQLEVSRGNLAQRGAEFTAAQGAQAQAAKLGRIEQTEDGSLVSVTQGPNGPVATPVMGNDGQPVRRRQNVPGFVVQGLAGNQKNLGVINRTLGLLGTQEGKEATGWKAYLPGKMLDEYVDPDGVDTRAGIGDIGSLVIHDRSGAAVTAAEFPRLRPFIPLATDDTKTVSKKLNRMAQIIEEEMNAMGAFYPGALDTLRKGPPAPGSVPPARGATGATPTAPAGGGRTVESLPAASSVPAGTRARNDQTGEVMVSDGKTWRPK